MTNIRDLAKLAGVSVTTVSRVLNQHPYVKEEKRKAVLEAIEATNYYRNINAVHLSKGKTQLMGVVIPYIELPYFSLLLKGIGKMAVENNYKLVLFQTEYAEAKEIEALEMLKQKQIDSLIFCSRKCDLSIIEDHLQYGRIVVCENTENQTIASSFVDHYQIFSYALEYLYNKGHKRIGYSIGRKKGTSSYYRENAYKDFLTKYNLPYNQEYIMDGCLYFEDGEKILRKIKKMKNPPTAYLVTSDHVAAGMLICCQQEGIKVPEELSIIGIGNDDIAKLMNITTINIPLIELGMSLFHQALQEDNRSIELEVTLIERGTV